MNTKNLLLESSFKFLFPFLALLISYYFFNISDWIKPISDIKDDKIKWAFDLAFNTSLINIIYELIKARFKPSIIYTVSITDRKQQNSVTLDYAEAEQILPLKCKISVQRDKPIKNIETEIRLDYPKWLTLEIDSIKHSDEEAFDHKKDENVLIVKPKHLFNENIKSLESYEVNLKVIARRINNYQGNIQPKIKSQPKYRALKVKSTTEAFKIKIVEG
ncbi:hypothetical protein [Bacillus dakarensis]|uniref:hypothetical protein n=1 Tax=Robertmurraya dakarensis TaxID=1926278 RepID=UPI0009825491|nr:hypothetical protein [Bacillus dakarensis]